MVQQRIIKLMCRAPHVCQHGFAAKYKQLFLTPVDTLLLPECKLRFSTSSKCSYSTPPAKQPITSTNQRKKVTIGTIRNMYKSGEPISAMTAQDYPSGMMVDKAGIDMCLVGDSLAMVALGYDSTNPITIDEMLHHCRAVARGCKGAFLIGDMPYGCYEVSPDEAVRSAIRFLKEGNVESVKLEGGIEMAETIHRITRIGVPVVGHIGLTPQRQSSLGGFRVQGKTAKQARSLWQDAVAVQEAGAFAILIEAVPEELAAFITSKLKVPTIGIGAGVGCSGQILVQNDVLGLFDRFTPKFAKQYANLGHIITEALRQYNSEVKSRSFPAKENTYPTNEAEFHKFLTMMTGEKELSANNSSSEESTAICHNASN